MLQYFRMIQKTLKRENLISLPAKSLTPLVSESDSGATCYVSLNITFLFEPVQVLGKAKI